MGSNIRKKRRVSVKRKAAMKRRIFRLCIAAVLIVLIIIAVRAFRAREISDYIASTASFTRRGEVEVTTIETFGKSYYDQDELRRAIRDAVDQYNQDNGGGKELIEWKGLTVRGGVATLILDYKSVGDYVSFNSAPMFFGTVKDAIEQGYDLRGILSAASRRNTSKILTQRDFEELSSNRLIYVTEKMNLVVPRRILYASGNLKVSADRQAIVNGTISESSPAILILE